MSPQALEYLSRASIPKTYHIVKQTTVEIFSTDPEEIERFDNKSLELLYLRPKINDLRDINQHLILINEKLDYGRLLVCNCETIEQRNQQLRNKYGKAYFLFYPIDFVYKRVASKLKGLKKIYLLLSHGKNRVLSKAEVLGRLYYCGFDIVKMEDIDNKLHLIVKKIKKPCDEPELSYGFIYKKRTTGKNGRTVFIKKFRTMHPYAEYLRDYILKTNGYLLSGNGNGTGKIKNDFRVTSWGRWMGKYWIEELPQIINILKGELKLMGLRPLSKSFQQEYPAEFLKERRKYKNGLLPPCVAHLYKSVEDVIEADKIYLAAYKKHPLLTDIKYLFWILYNILTIKLEVDNLFINFIRVIYFFFSILVHL